FNVVGEMKGTQLPNEYVMLSAHFDSWDGGSGATDNGTGTITMLEAMRILKQVYPSPRRTILVGHWSGEEQGLNGSRGYVHDHPEIVSGLQALFNQDNGTGRVENMSASGFPDAAASLARYLARVPADITRNIKFGFPGAPSGGGTDHASFVSCGAPRSGRAIRTRCLSSWRRSRRRRRTPGMRERGRDRRPSDWRVISTTSSPPMRVARSSSTRHQTRGSAIASPRRKRVGWTTRRSI